MSDQESDAASAKSLFQQVKWAVQTVYRYHSDPRMLLYKRRKMYVNLETVWILNDTGGKNDQKRRPRMMDEKSNADKRFIWCMREEKESCVHTQLRTSGQ